MENELKIWYASQDRINELLKLIDNRNVDSSRRGIVVRRLEGLLKLIREYTLEISNSIE